MYKSIIGKDKGNIHINNINYYYKRNDAYVELLMEKILDLFNLHHVHYKPINIENKDYYLSEDLNNNGQFVTALDSGIESSNLYTILDNTKNIHPNNNSLIIDIIKMYFIDLLTLNIDRNNDNWGFYTKDNITNIYLLDNDLCFIHYNSLMTTLDDNTSRDSILEIENIYKTFPEEYISLFNKMYDTLTIEMLNKIIKMVEIDINKELPHKNNYLTRYEFLRSKIEEIKNIQIYKKH